MKIDERMSKKMKEELCGMIVYRKGVGEEEDQDEASLRHRWKEGAKESPGGEKGKDKGEGR